MNDSLLQQTIRVSGPPKLVSLPNTRTRRGGFSLVEISLALAIVGFAFVAMLGLLAPGINNFSTALNTQTATEIYQRVAADLQETDMDGILDAKVQTGGTNGQFFRLPYRYFDVQGQEVKVFTPDSPSEKEKARIVYTVWVRGSNTGDANPNNHKPEYFTSLPGIQAPRFNPRDMIFLTIQVMHSKGKDVGPLVDQGSTFLVKPEAASKAGLQMRTYSLLVARNGYKNLN